MVETMTIKIIDKLKSLIESITIAQGVEFNMSGKVHVNALSFSEDDTLDAIQTPFVSILQNAREPFKTKDSVDQGQGSMVVFPLTIEAVMTNLTPDDWKEAEIFKAEVKRLIREAVVIAIYWVWVNSSLKSKLDWVVCYLVKNIQLIKRFASQLKYPSMRICSTPFHKGDFSL